MAIEMLSHLKSAYSFTRKNGLRNYFNGVLSQTLGAVGHYTSEFISFSTYSTGKFFPKYENLNTILQSNATTAVPPTITPTSPPRAT